MKKLTFLFVAAVAMLTSCLTDNGEEYTPVQTKHVDKITHANGSEIAIVYDSDMRIKTVNYVDALDAANNRSYQVYYNLDMTNNTVTYDIVCGDENYIMRFNEYGALSEFVLNGASPQVLSTFNYDKYTSINAFHLELQGVVDRLTGGETKRIEWSSYGVPATQINEIQRVIEGTTYTYSTSIQYSYLATRSNVHANVNLFNLITPEFLEHSNIPTELAATVSVFGTRSNYLPTDITLTYGRSEAGENYTQLSEVKREFSYDADENGYILKIYTGKEDNNNKQLLYTITYKDVNK